LDHFDAGPSVNAHADAIRATYATCCVTGYMHAIHALRDDVMTFRVLPEKGVTSGIAQARRRVLWIFEMNGQGQTTVAFTITS
jgi:hypothetical protein